MFSWWGGNLTGCAVGFASEAASPVLASLSSCSDGNLCASQAQGLPVLIVRGVWDSHEIHPAAATLLVAFSPPLWWVVLLWSPVLQVEKLRLREAGVTVRECSVRLHTWWLRAPLMSSFLLHSLWAVPDPSLSGTLGRDSPGLGEAGAR